MSVTHSQFFTRSLYNTHSPFNYTLVLDAHVNFCEPGDLEELFLRFKRTTVDISYSCRTVNIWFPSGYAILYRNTPIMTKYWRFVSQIMCNLQTCHDDQNPIKMATTHFVKEGLNFRWLSNNWFFAFSNVDRTGTFSHYHTVYASSMIINGRVRFIHKGIDLCEIVNGPHNEWSNRTRVGFKPDKEYRGIVNETRMIFSQEELIQVASPHRVPKINWKIIDKEKKDGLFWYK